MQANNSDPGGGAGAGDSDSDFAARCMDGVSAELWNLASSIETAVSFEAAGHTRRRVIEAMRTLSRGLATNAARVRQAGGPPVPATHDLSATLDLAEARRLADQLRAFEAQRDAANDNSVLPSTLPIFLARAADWIDRLVSVVRGGSPVPARPHIIKLTWDELRVLVNDAELSKSCLQEIRDGCWTDVVPILVPRSIHAAGIILNLLAENEASF